MAPRFGTDEAVREPPCASTIDLRNREPDTQSIALGGEEGLENPRQYVGFNSRAPVDAQYFHPARGALESLHFHLARFAVSRHDRVERSRMLARSRAASGGSASTFEKTALDFLVDPFYRHAREGRGQTLGEFFERVAFQHITPAAPARRDSDRRFY